MKLLLPIKPEFAKKILAGTKRFEFRKTMFKRKVDTVVIYASSPVKKIVGEFKLLGIISGAPDDVWSKCKAFAGVDKMSFDEYFQKSDIAFALEIGKVVRYDEPCDLGETYGIRPPQSFCYISDDRDDG